MNQNELKHRLPPHDPSIDYEALTDEFNAKHRERVMKDRITKEMEFRNKQIEETREEIANLEKELEERKKFLGNLLRKNAEDAHFLEENLKNTNS